MTFRFLFAQLLLALLGTMPGWSADRVLFHFNAATQLTRFPTNDARLSLVPAAQASVLRLATGTRQRWPGVTLPAPDGHWDLSPYARVTVAVRNTGTHRTTLHCRVDNPGADGTRHCVNGSLTLDAGQ